MADTKNEVVQPQQEIPLTSYPPSTKDHEKGATVLVRSDSDGSLIAQKPQPPRLTFWQQFPWSGACALFGVVICSVCAVAVIDGSNNKPKSTWRLKAAPNVLVSILTAISGILITMAVAQGMAISWWRRALRGTSVLDLHYSWQFSTSVLSLIQGYRFWNGMVLTALCTKFAIIDSTLFQKALGTTTALGPASQIQVPNYPSLVFPTTGTLNKFGNQTASTTYAMTYDTQTWTWSSSSIDAYNLNGFYWCEGLCGLTYRSIGFESICTQTNVSASRAQTEVESGTPNANLQMNVAFEQRWPTPGKDYSYINMEWLYWIANESDSGIEEDDTCGGRFMNLTCELRPSIIDYPISMRNSSYAQRDLKSKGNDFYVFLGPLNDTSGTIQGLYDMEDYTIDHQVPNFTVVSNINVPEQQVPGGNTSLGGIAYALQQYYGSSSTVSYANTTTTDPATGKQETSVQPIVSANGILASLSQNQATSGNCPLGYTAYYDSMLQNINTLMVILGDDVHSRPNYTDTSYTWDSYYWNYTDLIVEYVNATQYQAETYYVSRMPFAWGAFASTLVVVLLIVPSFWKFWELGRPVTMGPIDIIDALKSPSFNHLLQGRDGDVKGGVGNAEKGGDDHFQHGTPQYTGTPHGSIRQPSDHV